MDSKVGYWQGAEMPGGAGGCCLDAGQRVRRSGHGIEYFRQGEHHAPTDHAAAEHASASNPTSSHAHTHTYTYASRTAFGDTSECKLPWCDDGREQLSNHYTPEPRDGQRDNLQRKCRRSGIWDVRSYSPDEHCSGPKQYLQRGVRADFGGECYGLGFTGQRCG